jgi:hypothetical protein
MDWGESDFRDFVAGDPSGKLMVCFLGDGSINAGSGAFSIPFDLGRDRGADPMASRRFDLEIERHRP